MTDYGKLARLGIHVLDGGALAGTEGHETSVPASALREEGPLDREPTHPTPRVPGHGRSLTAGGRLSSSRSAPDVGDLAVTSTAPMTTVLPGDLVRAGALKLLDAEGREMRVRRVRTETVIPPQRRAGALDLFVSSASRRRTHELVTALIWLAAIVLCLAAWGFVGWLISIGAFT